jgi:hypothetical protein
VDNIKVVWTKDKVRRASLVSYDRVSAEHRMERLRAEGATDITTVHVKPGEDYVPEQPRQGRVVQRKHTRQAV